MRRCKPSAAFVEDELAMGLLDGGAVKTDGEGAVAVAAVFPSLSAPLLDRLGFRDGRWDVWRLR